MSNGETAKTNDIHCTHPPTPPCANIAIEGALIQPTQVTIQVGDTYSATFTDAGFFAYSPAGLFDPDLPTGYFLDGQNTPTVNAVEAGTITIFYLDTETNLPYVEYIIIT